MAKGAPELRQATVEPNHITDAITTLYIDDDYYDPVNCMLTFGAELQAGGIYSAVCCPTIKCQCSAQTTASAFIFCTGGCSGGAADHRGPRDNVQPGLPSQHRAAVRRVPGNSSEPRHAVHGVHGGAFTESGSADATLSSTHGSLLPTTSPQILRCSADVASARCALQCTAVNAEVTCSASRMAGCLQRRSIQNQVHHEYWTHSLAQTLTAASPRSQSRVQGGDLRTALWTDDIEGTYEWRWHRRGRAAAIDVAEGLNFLHSNGIVHR